MQENKHLVNKVLTRHIAVHSGAELTARLVSLSEET